MSKLSRAQLDALDKRLFQYKKINKLIALRKLEIETDNEHNSNIIKIKTNQIQNKPLMFVVKYSEDLTLQNLYLFRKTVEECYKQLHPELKIIFNKRWIEEYKTWPEIEKELNYATKSIYRKRTAILEKFAELKGEFIL